MFDTLLHDISWNLIGQILLSIVMGFLSINLITIVVRLLLRKHLNKQRLMIVQKLLFYSGTVLVLFIVLKQAGVGSSTIAGAAGIMGIALGVASQTSISNIISGIFMIGEQPFAVGDYIEVGTNKGIVMSIDMLSIKLRTFNNRLIRIPNENLIKSDVTNVTRYPIRRIDLEVSVAYNTNLREAITVLKETISAYKNTLESPEAVCRVDSFQDSGINIFMGIWCEKSVFYETKSALMIEIKEALEKAHIEIPYPHRKLVLDTDILNRVKECEEHSA